MSSSEEKPRRFYQTKTCRLCAMLSLTLSFFVVELVVGNLTKSVALVADAFHMLSDVISLVIGIVAVRFSRRKSNINTYGWVRAEVVGANINSVFLLALCLTIVFDVIRRFIEPETIENVDLLLIVGSVGLAINLVGLCLFQGFHGHTHGSHGHAHDSHDHSHSHEPSRTSDLVDQILEDGNRFERHSSRALQEVIADCAHRSSIKVEIEQNSNPKEKKTSASMNMHGVFLHVLADALGSVVVIISALIIKFVPHDPDDKKHWTVYIDPILSVIIVIIISISTIRLFRDTTSILLQTIPKDLQIENVKVQLLRKIPQIKSVHELHIWRLTDEKVIASAHLHRHNLENYMEVAEQVKLFFHSIGIHSLTVQYEHDNDQPEFSPVPSTPNLKQDDDCLLRCRSKACESQLCCKEGSVRSKTSTRQEGTETQNQSQQQQYDNPISIELSESKSQSA